MVNPHTPGNPGALFFVDSSCGTDLISARNAWMGRVRKPRRPMVSSLVADGCGGCSGQLTKYGIFVPISLPFIPSDTNSVLCLHFPETYQFLPSGTFVRASSREPLLDFPARRWSSPRGCATRGWDRSGSGFCY